MRTLFRTTLSILRQYPILWLPLILAELINVNITWFERMLQHSLMRQLLPWLTESHSVLAGATGHIPPTAQTIRNLSLILLPLGLGTEFVCIFLSAAALVVTAALLRSLAEARPATLPAALPSIAPSRRRILIFSLALLGLKAISDVLTTFLSPLVFSFNLEDKLERLLSLSLKSESVLEATHLIPNLVSHLWVLPIALCGVYIIAPLQARLAQPPNATPVPDQARQTRIAAILTAIAISTLSFLVAMLEVPLFQLFRLSSTLALYPVHIIASLVTVLPYVLLYIAFYLITTPDSPFAAIPDLPAPLPEPPQSPPESISV
jgi:hypothetical protein